MNNTQKQQKLIDLGLLDPPADGRWGVLSKIALQEYEALFGSIDKSIGYTGTTRSNSVFLDNIVRWMIKNDQFISRGRNRFNIVYVEGVSSDGSVNDDEFNEWNDRRIIFSVSDLCTPEMEGNWIATTEPGSYYTYNPMNPGGAFRIAFGQYKAWKFGKHGRNQYPALVQCGEIKGYRDKNKDGSRTGDPLVIGDKFQINQHHGWNTSRVDNNSAGCLVGKSIEGHWDFLEILSQDVRYISNREYNFYTTIIPGDQLEKI